MLLEGVANPLDGSAGKVIPVAVGVSAMQLNGIVIAASANYVSPVIDLGENFNAGLLLATFLGVLTVTSYFMLQHSADGLTGWTRMNSAYVAGVAQLSSTGADSFVGGRPLFRYVRFLFVNGTTAQPAANFNIGYLPGV